MLEKNIEDYLRKEVTKIGGYCMKWVSPSNRGVPDRILILPKGRVVFVELKQKGKKLDPLQKYFRKKFIALDQEHYVVDSKESADRLVRLL